jgi:cytoskeletal protein CcmA (bactofilin family)
MLRSSSLEGVRSEEATVISKGVKIEGKLSCSGNIRVDGNVKGDIISQGMVVVGENGQVNGQINADSISIGGNVTGTVRAKEKLSLDSKGNLKGDIIAKTLFVEVGAIFNGTSKMGDSVYVAETIQVSKSESTATK